MSFVWPPRESQGLRLPNYYGSGYGVGSTPAPVPLYQPETGNVNYSLSPEAMLGNGNSGLLPNFGGGTLEPTSWLQDMNGWGKKNGLWGGTTENPSMGGAILNTGKTLWGAYAGMQQYGLAKSMLEENKANYAKQYAAQRQMTNANMYDRQVARNASSPGDANRPGAYQSVGAYMGEHGVAA